MCTEQVIVSPCTFWHVRPVLQTLPYGSDLNRIRQELTYFLEVFYPLLKSDPAMSYSLSIRFPSTTPLTDCGLALFVRVVRNPNMAIPTPFGFRKSNALPITFVRRCSVDSELSECRR